MDTDAPGEEGSKSDRETHMGEKGARATGEHRLAWGRREQVPPCVIVYLVLTSRTEVQS